MEIILKKREISGKKVSNLRKTGVVPATIYGPKINAENLTIEKKQLAEISKTFGNNKIFEVNIESEKKPRKVLLKDLQMHPVTLEFYSASFYQIDEEKRINVDVPIVFEGVSPAIQQKLGFLIHQLDTVGVNCLPKDLPNNVTADLGTLITADDVITVGAIKLPENVRLASYMDKTSAVLYIGTSQKEIAETPKTEEKA